MAIVIDRYIGSNGDVLIPLGDNADNANNLISSNGTYYIVQSREVIQIEAGNPMGLLLTLTYPATP